MTEKVALVLSALGVLVSSIATLVAVLTQRKQRELTRSLHEDAKLLTQRRAFIDLWPLIARMEDIDATNIKPAVVVGNINKLELIAACWEGQMVDISLIRRTFQSRYVEMVDKIRPLPSMPELEGGKNGIALLRENPAVERLYNSLKQEMLDKDAVKPLAEAATKKM